MVVRFFFLQAHYRSTLDITDEALQAAEKGYKRLMEAHKILQSLATDGKNAANSEQDKEVNELIDGAFEDMSEDFNAPKAMSRLFELASKINAFKGGQLNINEITEGSLERLKKTFNDFIFNILGFKDEATSDSGSQALEGVMQLVIDLRAQARSNKDFATSDKIRDGLKEAGIQLKDSKEGTSWVKE